MLKPLFHKWIRWAAAITAAVYLFTNLDIGYAAPSLLGQETPHLNQTQQFQQSLALHLPAKLARFESLQPGRKGTIIHIQTAHGHYEAQLKTAKLLFWLRQQFGSFPILLEGASGKLDSSQLNFFKDKNDLNFQNALRLTRQALVSGPELYLIQNPAENAQGLETEEVYRSNHEQFVRVMHAQAEAQNFTAKFEQEVEREAARLSPELRSFLKNFEQFELGILSFETWLNELQKSAQKNLKLDLRDPAWQIHWPMLVRFFKIQSLTHEFNAQKYEPEKALFLKELQNRAGKELFARVEQLLGSAGQSVQLPEPQTENTFLEMLQFFPQNFNFEVYPQVTRFIALLVLQSQIQPLKLHSEIQRLETLIPEKLARNENEKQLIEISADYRLLKKLLSLQITPDEYDALSAESRASRIKPSEILKRLQKTAGRSLPSASLDRLFESALEFYRGARKRDQVMIERAEEYLKKHPSKFAVIETGGFHTDALRKHFEDEGYAYGLVTPAIQGLDETGYQNYLKAMMKTGRKTQDDRLQTIDSRSKSRAASPELRSSGSNQMLTVARAMDARMGALTHIEAAKETVRWVRGQRTLKQAARNEKRETRNAARRSSLASRLREGWTSSGIELHARSKLRSEFRGLQADEMRQRLEAIQNWSRMSPSENGNSRTVTTAGNLFNSIQMGHDGSWGFSLNNDGGRKLDLSWSPESGELRLNQTVISADKDTNPLIDFSYDSDLHVLTIWLPEDSQEEIARAVGDDPSLGGSLIQTPLMSPQARKTHQHPVGWHIRFSTVRSETRRAAEPVIPSEIIPSVKLEPLSAKQVEREFKRLAESGVQFNVPGYYRDDPKSLFSAGYTPKYKLVFFDTTFYLTHVRRDDAEYQMVAYVVQKDPKSLRPVIYTRFFYKDYSMIWRSASHYSSTKHGAVEWFGKGDPEPFPKRENDTTYTMEETTNLPLEIQEALDFVGEQIASPRTDSLMAARVLRGAYRRVFPYADFSKQRARDQKNVKNLINGNKLVAVFDKEGDPASLRFIEGFEPDFQSGIVGIHKDGGARTFYYGGQLTKYRVLSKNRKIQYQFIVGPKHVWMNPPQALTSKVMSYGVRTIDVLAEDDVFIPGYDYVYYENDGKTVHSQIPAGYQGEKNPYFEHLSDASAWHAKLPIIQQFRREVLDRGINQPNYQFLSQVSPDLKVVERSIELNRRAIGALLKKPQITLAEIREMQTDSKTAKVLKSWIDVLEELKQLQVSNPARASHTANRQLENLISQLAEHGYQRNQLINAWMDALTQFIAKPEWMDPCCTAHWPWELSLSVQGGQQALFALRERMDELNAKGFLDSFGLAEQEIALEAIYLARIYSDSEHELKNQIIRKIGEASPRLRTLADWMILHPFLEAKKHHSISRHKILLFYLKNKIGNHEADHDSVLQADKTKLLESRSESRAARSVNSSKFQRMVKTWKAIPQWLRNMLISSMFMSAVLVILWSLQAVRPYLPVAFNKFFMSESASKDWDVRADLLRSRDLSLNSILMVTNGKILSREEIENRTKREATLFDLPPEQLALNLWLAQMQAMKRVSEERNDKEILAIFPDIQDSESKLENILKSENGGRKLVASYIQMSSLLLSGARDSLSGLMEAAKNIASKTSRAEMESALAQQIASSEVLQLLWVVAYLETIGDPAGAKEVSEKIPAIHSAKAQETLRELRKMPDDKLLRVFINRIETLGSRRYRSEIRGLWKSLALTAVFFGAALSAQDSKEKNRDAMPPVLAEAKAEQIQAENGLWIVNALQRVKAAGYLNTPVESMMLYMDQYLVDDLQEQQSLIRSNGVVEPKFEFGPGFIYHGGENLDKALLTGRLTGKRYFTRTPHVWALEPFLRKRPSPAIYMLDTKTFNHYQREDKAHLKIEVHNGLDANGKILFDGYPYVNDGFDLADVQMIWINRTTWQHYLNVNKKIRLSKEEETILNNLSRLNAAGKVRVLDILDADPKDESISYIMYLDAMYLELEKLGLLSMNERGAMPGYQLKRNALYYSSTPLPKQVRNWHDQVWRQTRPYSYYADWAWKILAWGGLLGLAGWGIHTWLSQRKTIADAKPHPAGEPVKKVKDRKKKKRSEMRQLESAVVDLAKLVPEKYWDLPIAIDLFADNTGTLTNQHDVPQPAGIRQNLEQFIQNPDNRLVVNTGDDAPLVLKSQAELIQTILKTGARDRWFLTSAGGTELWRLDELGQLANQENIVEHPWQIPFKVKMAQALVNAFYDQLKILGDKVGLSDAEIEADRTRALAEIDAKEKAGWQPEPGETKNIIARFLSEKYGNKSYLYDSGSKMAIHGVGAIDSLHFFEAISEQVRAEIAKSGFDSVQVHYIPSFNFLDVSAVTKEDGVAAILKKNPLSRPGRLTLNVAIGDGLNDLPVLNHVFARTNHPEAGFAVVLKQLPAFADRIRGHVLVANREHMDGAEEVLAWLNQIQGKTVRRLIQEEESVLPLKKWARSERRTHDLTELYDQLDVAAVRDLEYWAIDAGVPVEFAESVATKRSIPTQEQMEDWFLFNGQRNLKVIRQIAPDNLAEMLRLRAVWKMFVQTIRPESEWYFEPLDYAPLFRMDWTGEWLEAAYSAISEDRFEAWLAEEMRRNKWHDVPPVPRLIKKRTRLYGYSLWTYGDIEKKKPNPLPHQALPEQGELVNDFREFFLNSGHQNLPDGVLVRNLNEYQRAGKSKNIVSIAVFRQLLPKKLEKRLMIEGSFKHDAAGNNRKFWIRAGYDSLSSRKFVSVHLSEGGLPVGIAYWNQQTLEFDEFDGPVFTERGNADTPRRRLKSFIADPFVKGVQTLELAASGEQQASLRHIDLLPGQELHLASDYFEKNEKVRVQVTKQTSAYATVVIFFTGKPKAGRPNFLIKHVDLKSKGSVFRGQILAQALESDWERRTPSSLMLDIQPSTGEIPFTGGKISGKIELRKAEPGESLVRAFFVFQREGQRKKITVYGTREAWDESGRPVEILWQGYYEGGEMRSISGFKAKRLAGEDLSAIQNLAWLKGVSLKPEKNVRKLTVEQVRHFAAEILSSRAATVPMMMSAIPGSTKEQILQVLREFDLHAITKNKPLIRTVQVGNGFYAKAEPITTMKDGRFTHRGMGYPALTSKAARPSDSEQIWVAFDNKVPVKAYAAGIKNTVSENYLFSGMKIFHPDGKIYSSAVRSPIRPGQSFIFSNFRILERGLLMITLNPKTQTRFRIPGKEGMRVSGIVQSGKLVRVDWFSESAGELHQPYEITEAGKGSVPVQQWKTKEKPVLSVHSNGKALSEGDVARAFKSLKRSEMRDRPARRSSLVSREGAVQMLTVWTGGIVSLSADVTLDGVKRISGLSLIHSGELPEFVSSRLEQAKPNFSKWTFPGRAKVGGQILVHPQIVDLIIQSPRAAFEILRQFQTEQMSDIAPVVFFTAAEDLKNELIKNMNRSDSGLTAEEKRMLPDLMKYLQVEKAAQPEVERRMQAYAAEYQKAWGLAALLPGESPLMQSLQNVLALALRDGSKLSGEDPIVMAKLIRVLSEALPLTDGSILYLKQELPHLDRQGRGWSVSLLAMLDQMLEHHELVAASA